MTQFLIQSGLLRALPSAGFDALPPSWVSAGAGGPYAALGTPVLPSHPQPGLEGAPRGNAELHRVPFQPG